MKFILPIAISFTLAATACDAHDHGHESPAVDACGHFANGPAAPLTASPDAGTAPLAPELHTRYDVTLVDVGGSNGGFVSFAVSEASEYNVFLGADVTAELALVASGVITPEAEGTTDADCAAVARWYTWDLAIGTYVLELDAVSASTAAVGFVRNTSDHDDHDH